MAFGLTGAPGTFQGAPGLCRFVLVFFDDILVYSPILESHASGFELINGSLSSQSAHLLANLSPT